MDMTVTRQCYTAPNCFHKQKSIEYRAVLQQCSGRGPWNNAWAREIRPLLCCQRGMSHHKAQAINHNNQQRGDHVVQVNNVYYAVHLPIYGKHYIKAWPRPIQSRLVMPEQ